MIIYENELCHILKETITLLLMSEHKDTRLKTYRFISLIQGAQERQYILASMHWKRLSIAGMAVGKLIVVSKKSPV